MVSVVRILIRFGILLIIVLFLVGCGSSHVFVPGSGSGVVGVEDSFVFDASLEGGDVSVLNVSAGGGDFLLDVAQ